MPSEDLSRRDVLTGRIVPPPKPETHISSLVVNVRPEMAGAARAALALMSGVEVHAATESKLALTLETDSEAEIVTRLNEISLLDGVMSAALVFHHYEPAADADVAAQPG